MPIARSVQTKNVAPLVPATLQPAKPFAPWKWMIGTPAARSEQEQGDDATGLPVAEHQRPVEPEDHDGRSR